jgi:Cft2 family RNA processing exonuclease
MSDWRQLTRIIRHISHMQQSRGWERRVAEGPPCVVLASPGMLQSGTSRELLELWAPDPKNGLIITGFSVEGTLARVYLDCVCFRSLTSCQGNNKRTRRNYDAQREYHTTQDLGRLYLLLSSRRLHSEL